ncbi:hypothetical protein [Hyphobacterium sp.]|uniref:hypothetical protein n=1 Tax=Hyphobacterium sp. TaxID=2004662 RepID=UPI003BAC7F17
MDMKRFEELADIYGGELERWPEDVRQQAEAFAAEETAATDYLRDAAKIDGLLAGVKAVPASELLVRKILQSAPKPAFDADWRRPAIAAAFALIFGLAGGFAGGLVTPVSEQDDDLVSLDYADPFDGLEEDWSAWDWSDT